MDSEKKCPYCAETIKVEAKICRFCKSDLTNSKISSDYFRNHPEKQILGVATSISKALNLPLVAVRIAFIVLAFIHGLGIFVYFGLYLFIPFNQGDRIPCYGLWKRIKDFLGFKNDHMDVSNNIS